MTWRWKLAGLLLMAWVVLGLGWSWLSSRNTNMSMSAPAIMRERLTVMTEETPLRTAALEGPATAATKPAPASGSTGTTAAVAQPVSRETIVRREIDHRLDILATAHAMEQSDPLWSPRAESLLADIAGSPDLPKTRALRTVCKQSLCMAEYATESSEDYQRLAEHADIGGTEGYFVEVPAEPGDSARHLLVYLARPGYSLPSTR